MVHNSYLRSRSLPLAHRPKNLLLTKPATRYLRAPAAPPAPCEVGAVVEYFSSTNQAWIPARVLAYSAADGLYELNVKWGVPPDRIRKFPM